MENAFLRVMCPKDKRPKPVQKIQDNGSDDSSDYDVIDAIEEEFLKLYRRQLHADRGETSSSENSSEDGLPNVKKQRKDVKADGIQPTVPTPPVHDDEAIPVGIPPVQMPAPGPPPEALPDPPAAPEPQLDQDVLPIPVAPPVAVAPPAPADDDVAAAPPLGLKGKGKGKQTDFDIIRGQLGARWRWV